MSETEFVKLWMGTLPTVEIAAKMKTGLPSVYTRASKLRALGVNLPPRSQVIRRESVPVERLNKLVAKLS